MISSTSSQSDLALTLLQCSPKSFNSLWCTYLRIGTTPHQSTWMWDSFKWWNLFSPTNDLGSSEIDINWTCKNNHLSPHQFLPRERTSRLKRHLIGKKFPWYLISNMITNSHLNISTKGNCKNKPQNPSSLMSFDSRKMQEKHTLL